MLSINRDPRARARHVFGPADRIERLTSEPSNARLHSNKRTSTRSAPRSAIGVRRRIGAAPLARQKQSGRCHQNDRSVQRGHRARL